MNANVNKIKRLLGIAAVIGMVTMAVVAWNTRNTDIFPPAEAAASAGVAYVPPAPEPTGGTVTIADNTNERQIFIGAASVPDLVQGTMYDLSSGYNVTIVPAPDSVAQVIKGDGKFSTTWAFMIPGPMAYQGTVLQNLSAEAAQVTVLRALAMSGPHVQTLNVANGIAPDKFDAQPVLNAVSAPGAADWDALVYAERQAQIAAAQDARNAQTLETLVGETDRARADANALTEHVVDQYHSTVAESYVTIGAITWADTFHDIANTLIWVGGIALVFIAYLWIQKNAGTRTHTIVGGDASATTTGSSGAQTGPAGTVFNMNDRIGPELLE